jgi:para-aminobenzoate synthetase/4-amino-4-deoxychorismate lyase
MSVVVFSPDHDSLVRYERPSAVFEAYRHDEVPQILAFLEGEVERTGLHAAGFLAYEAGSAFDAAMPAASCAPFPLAWFGLFGPPVPAALDAGGFVPSLAWTSELDERAHAAALDRIRGHLAGGETYQVNFTHRLRAPFAGDPWALFCRLASRQPSPHCAYVDAGNFAVCCASPELFFAREGRTVWSRPMKGTAPRGRWLGEDRIMAERLVRSEKERAENVMIVDMVRNDLGRVCLPGSVRVPDLFRAERYPTLWQLTSLVEGRTDEPTARVMAALFPAASITGAPKVRTMHLIDELEISPRRIYTGTVGVMLPGGRARFNVAIRTVLVDRTAGSAEYGVGGASSGIRLHAPSTAKPCSRRGCWMRRRRNSRFWKPCAGAGKPGCSFWRSICHGLRKVRSISVATLMSKWGGRESRQRSARRPAWPVCCG